MTNRETFTQLLTEVYTDLFVTDPKFANAARNTTPPKLANLIVSGLLVRSANIGDGVKQVCKTLRIKPTYKAITEYLTQSASLSYGVTCSDCNNYETECAC